MERYDLILIHRRSLLRNSLAALVARQAPFHLLAEGADPPTLKQLLAFGHRPHLLLLCWDNATADDHALLHWLARHHPNCTQLVLGHHEPTPDLVPLFVAGAHGYLNVHEAPEALHKTMTHLVDGAICYPACTWAALRQRLPYTRPRENLRMPSPLQCEFLRQVAAPDCPSYAEVAKRMGKSIHAVEQYRMILFRRYGIKGKGGLVRLAMELGLV